MTVSRLRRAGILLLVLWLTADVAAFGFCRADIPTRGIGGAGIGPAGAAGDGACCCTGHHCFCCSSGAEIVTYDLSVDAQMTLMTSPAGPNAPDFRLSDASPPPRS